MEILVIGVEPPCVRCQRVLQLANDVSQQLAPEINVRKISVNSEEAKKYGKVVTPHDMAELTEIEFDIEKIRKTGQVWSRELDNYFMPHKEKAEEMGYLMTPVLLINGNVKAMGFVPSREEIQEWIESELKR